MNKGEISILCFRLTEGMSRIDIKPAQPRQLTNRTHGFQIRGNYDPYTCMQYIEAFQGGKSVGHLDYSTQGKWMIVKYGCFATSQEGSLAEFLASYRKDVAIEVNAEIREKFRGVGSAMVSRALHYGKRTGLEGMRILNSNPKTQLFWEKLGFIRQGDDMLLSFKTQNIPVIDIRRKDQT